LDELCQTAHKYNIAIIAREPLSRGFLTDSYTTGIRLSQLASAPKKTVELYGKNEIELKIRAVRKIFGSHSLPLAELALQFVLANSFVTTVIPGISKKGHLLSNLSINETDLDPTLIKQLQNLPDLQRMTS